ncbi:MAG: type II toxin-antitoxin system RelE/ParE family toxin [Caldilineaceae bacterium]|nr:type II toxin-antitoxin system RelE/ParE family toxin [Caldilineaceae bacterium]
MTWYVEYTDEFGNWWDRLTAEEQESVAVYVRLLEVRGPSLPFPYCSGIQGSRHSHMRELRVQHQGRPYRVLYAFDPRRVAILLIGGDKTGNDHWYTEYVPIADRLYDEHLQTLGREGLI